MYSASLDTWEYVSTAWEELYQAVQSITRRLVFSSKAASWERQEGIVETIVQETMRRLLKYSQRSEHREVTSIQFFKRMSIVIAHNCYNDLRRRACYPSVNNQFDTYEDKLADEWHISIPLPSMVDLRLRKVRRTDYETETLERVNFPCKQQTIFPEDRDSIRVVRDTS